ncbi:hypothetical protein AtubIFM55763_005820 [Aspergillus tubingensis]|uniref:Uncharacterized protein n=1 Tax=Aspergillus tubingensis (strain CBS 134.48) TaxID=767770 RepID=A0A1L9NEI4_ASPTC|nr:uncharacterized protein AtWU_09236 [Aspergillus tubingensis]OJI87534.1 hypothetical protein ASPTUDRAFT_81042 [Aspergillus tubingensis CBS 134.48]GFN19432.1 hypothetical protein AtWU_09236 [Aspergillus tubingensis]GLA74575.1 hypothetical protein AtubIFM55763_005820 [Aspergillus tubingensis]GLA92110.1 hypothetical protein AtubIFM57143_006773 [Aspergillus tubingensis]GLB14626.1 hypothetical protein AtubIFM61612_004418 [Aspergillus tubingensis]
MLGNILPKGKAFARLPGKRPSTDVRGVYSESDGDSLPGYARQQHMWSPVILRSVSLAVFVVLFICFIIVIEVLYSVSTRKEGLSTSEERYHYLWTYGPTAVLTIVAGFWGQVEYRTKQLMPWKLMSHEPEHATRSLLLDYVSDWNVVILFRALKQSSWAVVLAVLGTLLIKLITVVSTGLFMLQNVYLKDVPTTLTTQASFNGAGYNGSKVDGTAAMVVAGAWWLNLSYPLGSTDKYAFQPFTTSGKKLGADAVISGTVDMFSADLQCDVATVANWTSGCSTQMCEYDELNMTLSTPSCSKYPFTSFEKSSSSVGGYYADVFSATCTDTDSADSLNQRRLIFAAAHWSENSTQIQALVCSPTYTISQGSVTLLYGNQSVTRIQSYNNDTSNRTITGFEGMELGTGLISSLSLAENTLDTLNYVDTSTHALTTYQYNLSDPNSTYPSAFYLVANLTSPHTMKDLLDASILEKVSRPTFSAMAAQIARQYLLSSADENLAGTYSAHTQRVVVRELSVRIMEATLGVLIILTAALWIWRPVRCTSRDPGTIAGLASIMGRSPKVSERLTGCKNAQDLTTNLSDGRFFTRVTDSDGWRTFGIEEDQKATEATRPGASSGPLTWWRPISVNVWWWLISIVLPLLIIAGLEASYQVSARQDGLGTVTSGGYIHYVWAYLPALIFLIVRIFFDCIHFSAMVFQPYLELRQGGVTAPGSLMENHLSKLTLFSFFTAIKRKQWAVCATGFTVLLAPALTVAVSGLYSTQDIVYTRPASIARIDTFNTTISPLSSTTTDPGLGLTGALVVGANLSYPAWTYDELVLPTLSEASLTDKEGVVQTNSSSFNSTSDSPILLNVTLPALRANLTCDALPQDIVYYIRPAEDSFSMFDLRMQLDKKCQGVDTSTDFTIKTDYPNATRTTFGAFKYLEDAIDFGDCPALMGFYGVIDGNSTAQIRGFTCNPQIDEVDATTSLSLPGLEIQSATADDSTSRVFSTNISTTLEFESFLSQPVNKQDQAFDAFFSAMLNDQKSLSLSDITDPSHYSTVINATEHLYRTLMAQSMNGNARIPSSDNRTTFPGTIVDPNRTRLTQSAISTRILEAFLAAMVVSTLVASYFMQTKEVLPFNPCSIAGAGALIAGSDVLKSDALPAGSEWCNDRDMLRRGYFSGLVFGLGWWAGDDPRFGIDVGRATEERE